MSYVCICGLASCVCGLEVPEDFDPSDALQLDLGGVPSGLAGSVSGGSSSSTAADDGGGDSENGRSSSAESAALVPVPSGVATSKLPSSSLASGTRSVAMRSRMGLVESTFFRQDRVALPDRQAQMQAALSTEAARLRALSRKPSVASKRRSSGPCDAYEPPSYSSLTIDEAEVLAAYCTIELASSLVQACDSGDEGAMCELLSEFQLDPNQASSDGRTPLIAAAAGGHSYLIACLMEQSASQLDLDDVDRDGRSAFWWACACGHAHAAAFLLECGASAAAPLLDGSGGGTTTAAASWMSSNESGSHSTKLLSSGLLHGASALAAAVAGGHDGVVALLLDVANCEPKDAALEGAQCGLMRSDRSERDHGDGSGVVDGGKTPAAPMVGRGLQRQEICQQVGEALAAHADSLDEPEIARALRVHLKGEWISSDTSAAPLARSPAARHAKGRAADRTLDVDGQTTSGDAPFADKILPAWSTQSGAVSMDLMDFDISPATALDGMSAAQTASSIPGGAADESVATATVPSVSSGIAVVDAEDSSTQAAGAAASARSTRGGAGDEPPSEAFDERGCDERGYPVWHRVPSWLSHWGGPRGSGLATAAALAEATEAAAVRAAARGGGRGGGQGSGRGRSGGRGRDPARAGQVEDEDASDDETEASAAAGVAASGVAESELELEPAEISSSGRRRAAIRKRASAHAHFSSQAHLTIFS